MVNAGVLLQGRLRVERDDGSSLLSEPGPTLIGLVNTLHRGVSLGPQPALIVVVYAGAWRQPTTVPVLAPASP